MSKSVSGACEVRSISTTGDHLVIVLNMDRHQAQGIRIGAAELHQESD